MKSLAIRVELGLLIWVLAASVAYAQNDSGQGGLSVGRVTRFKNATARMVPTFGSNTASFDSKGAGVCLFDYDNDGRTDIFLTNNANPTILPQFLRNSLNPEGRGVSNSLYHNDGNDPQGVPSFSDVSRETGVRDLFAIGYGCVAADLDNDGAEDLFVANGLKAVDFSMYGMHIPGVVDMGGFMDPEGVQLPPLFAFDSPKGQLDGEFVVATDPATGRQRGQGRNSLFRNTLKDGAKAGFKDITDDSGDIGGTKGKFPGGTQSTSACAADVDGDGYVDLLVLNFGSWNFDGFYRKIPASDGSNLIFHGEKWALYHNNGNMTFTDITDQAGVTPRDNPPYIFNMTGKKQSVFDPTMKDVAGHPVGENWPHAWSCGFMDYDLDGRPDLWIAPDVPSHIFLFHNETPKGGPVKFVDVSRESGVAIIGDWMGIAFGDFNEDLKMDVFATNFGGMAYAMPGPDDPHMQFIVGTGEYHRWQKYGAQLHAFFRNDGLSTTMIDGKPAQVPVFPNIAGSVQVDYGRFLRPMTSNPAMVAFPKSPLFGLEPYEFGWSAVAFDYDNDSHADIYYIGGIGRGGDGSLGSMTANPGRLLKGDGRMNFTDVTVEAHALNISGVNYSNIDAGRPQEQGDRIDVQLSEDGRSVATADFNNDGFPDLLITNVGGFDSNLPNAAPLMPPPSPLSRMKAYTPGPAFLFINEGNANHWLKVRLVGAMRKGDAPFSPNKSNRDGIGATLIATFRLNGQTTRRIHQVIAGSGHQSEDSLIQIFGLKGADRVDSLEIRWPSGMNQTFRDIAANQTITIFEGRSAFQQGLIFENPAAKK